MKAPSTLVIALIEPPVYILCESPVSNELLLEGRRFVDSGLGSIAGHYDWLHSSDGQLIGVRNRMFSAPMVAELQAVLANNSAVEVIDANVLVYFTSNRQFDEKQSYDLECAENRVLVADKVLALTFDIGHLSEPEICTLRGLTATR